MFGVSIHWFSNSVETLPAHDIANIGQAISGATIVAARLPIMLVAFATMLGASHEANESIIHF